MPERYTPSPPESNSPANSPDHRSAWEQKDVHPRYEPQALPDKPQLDRRRFVKSAAGAMLGVASMGWGGRSLRRRETVAEEPAFTDFPEIPEVPELTVMEAAAEIAEVTHPVETQPWFDARPYVEMRIEELPTIDNEWVREAYGGGDVDAVSPPELGLTMEVDASGYVVITYSYPGLIAHEFVVYVSQEDFGAGQGIRVPAENGSITLADDLELQALFNKGEYQLFAVQAVMESEDGYVGLASASPQLANPEDLTYVAESQLHGIPYLPAEEASIDQLAVPEVEPAPTEVAPPAENGMGRSLLREWPIRLQQATARLGISPERVALIGGGGAVAGQIYELIDQSYAHGKESRDYQRRSRSREILDAALAKRIDDADTLWLTAESPEVGPGPHNPEQLEQLKAEYVTQRYAVSSVLRQALALAAENPMSAADVLVAIDAMPQARILPPDQWQMIVNALEIYSYRHEMVEEIRSDYSHDRELFAFLFGHPPLGEVEIEKRPMSLNVRCLDIRDYALISYPELGEDRSLFDKETRQAARSGGMYYWDYNGIVTSENLSRVNPKQANDQSVRVHEEQHALYNLVESALPKNDHAEDFANRLDQLERTTDATSQLATVESLLRLFRISAIDTMAQDELLAFTTDGQWSTEMIYAFLAQSAADNGLYDYAAMEKRELAALVEVIKDRAPTIADDQIKAVISKVLVDEYRVLLQKGLDSIQTLVKSGLTKEEAAALLMFEELHQWDKVASRFKAFAAA